MAVTRVALIDRDGTLNLDKEYVTDPRNVGLIPGAADAIADLKKAGFLVAIVSNQSAIGRGWALAADVDRTNAELLKQLTDQNPAAIVDQVLYCPHLPEANCSCRKPKAGMLSSLRAEFLIEPATCWVFGDKWSDVELGLNIGLEPSHCCLVLTGSGEAELQKAKEDGRTATSLVFKDLRQAVTAVLATI